MCMQFVTAKARLDWVPVPPAYVTTALMMLAYKQAQRSVHCETSMELVSSPRSEGLVKSRAGAIAV